MSRAAIEEHRRRPLLEKLRWLEEMLRFDAAFLTAKARKSHELFRSGAI